MYDVVKKIEYCLIKMIYEELDIYIDDEYNIKFTKEDNNIQIELGIKLNYELEFNKLFTSYCIDHCTYNIYIGNVYKKLDNILYRDKEKLFVTRYKKYLQPLEKMLIYLCIDQDNEFIYNEYNTILKNTIQQLNYKMES